MEDNSYISLSLEKYNELYYKAKIYDELVSKCENKDLTECIEKAIYKFKKYVYGDSFECGEVGKYFAEGFEKGLKEEMREKNESN